MPKTASQKIEKRKAARQPRKSAQQRDDHANAVSFESQILQLHGELGNQAVGQMLEPEVWQKLRVGIRRVQALIEGGRAGHEDLETLRNEQPIVSFISTTIGGKSFPDPSIWDEPQRLLTESQAALAIWNLRATETKLKLAAESASKAMNRIVEYREGSIAGAKASQISLEIVRDVSLVTSSALATLATGGVAGAAIGAGIEATTRLAEETYEAVAGLRKEIDWAGIAFDSIIEIITSKLLGKLGQKLHGKLLQIPEVATFGQKLTVDMIVDLLEGRGETFLQVTAKTLFDNLRNSDKKVTLEEFLNLLVDEVFSARGVFTDLLGGQLSGHIESAYVWVNTKSRIYHPSDSRFFRKTKQGRFMTKAQADAAGFRPAKRGRTQKIYRSRL